MPTKPTGKKPLLSDHKKIGKKLVPPMMQIGSLRLTSWVDTGLPESIWLAVLHEELGLAEGVKIAVELCKIATTVEPATFFVVSDFEVLSPDSWQEIRAKLDVSLLSKTCGALSRFFRVYPECPLVKLCKPPDDEPSESDIQWVKQLLSTLFDKASRPSTLALATLVYVQMAQGRLFIQPGSALSKLPDVEQYPDTPESRRVASAVRATVNSFGGRADKPIWPRYFWARNFAIQPCYFQEDGDEPK
jgi:hypothetical protein